MQVTAHQVYSYLQVLGMTPGITPEDVSWSPKILLGPCVTEHCRLEFIVFNFRDIFRKQCDAWENISLLKGLCFQVIRFFFLHIH